MAAWTAGEKPASNPLPFHEIFSPVGLSSKENIKRTNNVMINTRLNELQGYKTSYLVNAKTVSG